MNNIALHATSIGIITIIIAIEVNIIFNAIQSAFVMVIPPFVKYNCVSSIIEKAIFACRKKRALASSDLVTV